MSATPMDSDLASAFQNGSGINTALMKDTILSLTAAVLMLVLAWVAMRLWQAQHDDQIGSGEMLGQIVLLAAVITALLAILGLY